MKRWIASIAVVLGCGEGRADAPAPEATDEAAATPRDDRPGDGAPDEAAAAPRDDRPGDGAPDDAAAACRETAPLLDRMAVRIAEAESIPLDRGLYELAARLSQTRRELAIAGHEQDRLDAAHDAPDFVLRPAADRAAHEAARRRVARTRDEQLATEAALRDEAARSIYPAVAAPDGPRRVLASIRWRDAADHVRRHRAACANATGPGAPVALEVAALRDFATGIALVERDVHEHGTRSLERRVLAGQPLLPGLR